MLSYRFYIRDNQASIPTYIEIEEPVGWDSCAFTLQRSDQFDGLENIYSDNLTFYGKAGEILLDAFNNYGFDALLDFKIEFYCDGILNTTIENVINMLTYKRVGNETTVTTEESSFGRKFKSRYETQVNFNDELSIEGKALTPLEPFTLKLHSKEIIVESTRKLDDIYDKTNYKYSVKGIQGDYAAPPYNIIVSDSANIGSGSGFQLIEKTYFFQYDFSQIITNDDTIGSFYDIPYGGGPTANPFLKIANTGKITIDLNFNVCCQTNINDNSSNLLGLLAKLRGCSDSTSIDGKHLNDSFQFDLYIKIGATEYTFPLSNEVRGGCSERYYGDLIGKINWEDNSNDPDDGEFIIPKPTKYRFINVALNQSFDCLKGDDICILIRLKTSGEYEKRLANTRIIVYGYTWIDKTNSFLNIKNIGIEKPSSSNAYMIYEAFNRVCEAMTDQKNAFRSNFFGRINSAPQTYLQNGCAAWIAVTNGLNLRNMLDANGNFRSVSMSFFELFRSFNAIFNLGARVEFDGDGSLYIRVEPKEYFYNNYAEIFTVSSPTEITTEVAIDKLYNDIQIGYEKWQIDNLNGIDEFNASHTYTIPLTNVKKRLEVGSGNGVTSPFIGGGYAIETTRRIQYSQNPTTDWQYDNDNFIICLNQNIVTSDQYSNPPVAQDYLPGEVSERDENYISIENLLSPSTAYNLRISPGNMILNWFKSLAPSILLKKDPNRVIKFQSGSGNYQMITHKIPDDCIIALNDTIIEDQDLTQYITKYSNLQLIALYTPTYISFDYPIDFGNFITIKEGSNKLIRVECDDLVYFGFIKELKFTPNDGSANFKILLTGCFKGGFTSGFSSGFEIGTC